MLAFLIASVWAAMLVGALLVAVYGVKDRRLLPAKDRTDRAFAELQAIASQVTGECVTCGARARGQGASVEIAIAHAKIEHWLASKCDGEMTAVFKPSLSSWPDRTCVRSRFRSDTLTDCNGATMEGVSRAPETWKGYGHGPNGGGMPCDD